MEQITKEELLDVTGKFELGNHIEVVSVEPYGSGHINDTFRLEVKEDGKEKLYILQRMNKDIFKNQKELMDNILQVTSFLTCLLYTSPSPRDYAASRMPSSA